MEEVGEEDHGCDGSEFEFCGGEVDGCRCVLGGCDLGEWIDCHRNRSVGGGGHCGPEGAGACWGAGEFACFECRIRTDV